MNFQEDAVWAEADQNRSVVARAVVGAESKYTLILGYL